VQIRITLELHAFVLVIWTFRFH